METRKIANLFGDADNDSNQRSEMKIVQPLNLKPKSLKQIFVIIQAHIFL